MINPSNNNHVRQPNQPQHAHAELALPAWMRVGYRASSGWRETQALQVQAEKPGLAWASELRLSAAISLTCVPACTIALLLTVLSLEPEPGVCIGNGNGNITTSTPPTKPRLGTVTYSPVVLPIEHQRLQYMTQSTSTLLFPIILTQFLHLSPLVSPSLNVHACTTTHQWCHHP
jgi:hypothetical protein